MTSSGGGWTGTFDPAARFRRAPTVSCLTDTGMGIMTLSQLRHGDKPVPIAVPVWAWVLVLYGLVVLFVVLQENGLAFVLSAQHLHDFFHDARHSLGVPCH